MDLMYDLIRDRHYWEELEDRVLASYAIRSREAIGSRLHGEQEHSYRTAFQRDRDRIIHSRAFRRLKHKQQVFLITEGDHYRTRLTHTYEVSQISRTLAKLMGLNEELVEAIALGHDLGHTPFGHTGEVVLHKILIGDDDLNGVIEPQNLGGFKHNYQSLMIVDSLEKKYHDFDGLNLTSFVREGILKHTRLKRSRILYHHMDMRGIHFEYDFAFSLEGQIVAIADEVAQRTHDLEDGIRANLVTLEDVRKLEIVKMVEDQLGLKKILGNDPYAYRNSLITGLINLLVTNIAITSLSAINKTEDIKNNFKLMTKPIIDFGKDINDLQRKLDLFISKNIIGVGFNKNANIRNREIIRTLFAHYLQNPDTMPVYIINKIRSIPEVRGCIHGSSYELGKLMRIIGDYIASMTDRFAELTYKEIEE